MHLHWIASWWDQLPPILSVERKSLDSLHHCSDAVMELNNRSKFVTLHYGDMPWLNTPILWRRPSGCPHSRHWTWMPKHMAQTYGLVRSSHTDPRSPRSLGKAPPDLGRALARNPAWERHCSTNVGPGQHLLVGSLHVTPIVIGEKDKDWNHVFFYVKTGISLQS